MAAIILNSADIMDFNNFPDPQSVSAKPGGAKSEFATQYHPGLGTIKFESAMFPHMHVMDLRWQSEQEIALHDATLSDTVNINFHMAGKLDTKFWGISHELNMRPQTHNLVFSPDSGYVNYIRSNSYLEMFHVSLEKDFFKSAIGCDDHWSEQVQRNLESNRSFSGMTGTLNITPTMFRLINEIRECESTGPMRNLMIQSRTLELLALQIEQFRTPAPLNEEIRPDEAEKLYQLKAYLDADFLQEMNLTQLSKMCLLNEFKVKKGFKILFGTTVFGYLRQKRMDYAKRLLLDCAFSVEEVADILGYEHANHFSAAFRKFTGQSPSSYGSKKEHLTTMVQAWL
jgi:AraC family transcriptional activator of pyochelin receptor